jgi:hypothetical protein
VAANYYNEVVTVSVRDQSATALNTVQKNVERAESSLNRVSANPFNIVVKATDMLTKPLEVMLKTAYSTVSAGLTIPVRISDMASAPLRAMMSVPRGLAGGLAGGLVMGAGMAGFGLVAQGIGEAKDSIIGMNATLETSTLQFETLMGNADEAKQHVLDLFQFAKATPFETQPVINASRTLRTFGGAALDTMDNLTLFGDAAAATNSNIEEVSFWMGRAYAAMKGGQPFGEATMRLQELAILSPDAALKLTKLSASGATLDQMWGVMTQSLQRFNGAMAKQATTWEGLTSTLSDAIKITSAKVFQPLFNMAKGAVSGLIDILSSDAFMAWSETAGQAIADFAAKAGGYFGDAKDFVTALWTSMTDDKGAVGIMYDLIRKVFGDGVGDFVQPALQAFMDFIPTLREVGRWLGYAFQDLMRGDVGSVLTDIIIGFQQLTGLDISGLRNIATWLSDRIGSALSWLANTAWPRIQDAMGAVMSFIVVEVVPKLQAVWSWLQPNLEGAVAWLTNTAWPGIQSAMATVIDFVNSTVLPRLADLRDSLQPHLETAFKAAQDAANNFQIALSGAPTATDAAAASYGQLAIVLEPLVGMVGDLGRIWRDVTVIGASLGDAIQKLSEYFTGLPDPVKALLALPIAPFILALDTMRTSLDVVAGGLDILAEKGPHIGDAFDALGTRVNQFLTWLQTVPGTLIKIGTDMMNGLIQGMASVDLMGWIRSNVTDKIPQFIKDALGIHSPSQVFSDIGSRMMQGLLGGLQGGLPQIMSFVGGLGGMFGSAAGSLGDWIAAAIQYTNVPAFWAGPLAALIGHESSGNPNAINNWDVNAQRGDPSSGLMQLTQSNQATYTPTGMSRSDPVAQIIAGIRYIMATYGDIASVPGIASLAAGGAYQPYDTGGILPPGLTLAANNTGQNEIVMTQAQLAGLGGMVFAPSISVDARGAAPGVGQEISDAMEEYANTLFAMLGAQLRMVLGNMATSGGAT